MLGSEIREVALNGARSLTDDFEIANDGILLLLQ